MDVFESLAVAQAIYKAVADEVSTKGFGLRYEADEYMRARYEESGEKLTKRLTLNGVEVGTISTRESKPVAEKTLHDVRVEDWGEFRAWLDGHQDVLAAYISDPVVRDDLAERAAEWHFCQTGELPDGCGVETIVQPAQPRGYAGTVLKVDSAKVAEALQGQLPAVVQGLLEGGE